MIPNTVTVSYLRERVKLLAEYLAVPLSMEHNSYKRWAVFIDGGDMLTPGYRSNSELACWISGVFLFDDKGDTLDEER